MKIISVACMLRNPLYVWPSAICWPGAASSVRMSSAMMPPHTMKKRVAPMYWMPMTLWSVFTRKYCFQLLTPWKEWSSDEMRPPLAQVSQ